MTTLLAKQVAAFRQEHGIASLGPKRTAPPSVLFTPQEAKRHDPEVFAALALRGIDEASLLDPDIASYSSLFEGPQKDRDLLTREENAALDAKIHALLVLLSPHMQARAAQECLEGLLYRYHVHRWNVDDLMGAVLPHHDSPLFTKLVQGLHIEGKPLWSWLTTLKAKPATLVRSALAKYCTKDISVLNFLGQVMEENLKLQKANRALMTFYAALWLDTLALLGSLAPELVQALLPTLLLMLRRPSQKDAFHAGLTIAGALCAKVDLEAGVQSKIINLAARQAKGEEGQPATALIAAVMQLQAVSVLPSAAISTLAKHGAEEVLRALPVGVDCGNLLSSLVQAALAQLADADEASGDTKALVLALLGDSTLRAYSSTLSTAVLQAFVVAIANHSSAKQRKRIAKIFQAPVKLLSDTVPAALAEAFRWAVDQALTQEVDAEPLVSLLAPACAAVPEDESEKLVPAVQAFHHKSAKVRTRAVQKAVAELAEEKGGEGAEERRRLMAGLALQVVDDENVEVVAVALKQEALWTSAQVAAGPAAGVLSAAFRRLLRIQPKGKNLAGLFRSLLQEDSRVRAILPLVIQASAWVYSREDADEDVQQRLDTLLLPVILLAFAGLDSAEEIAGPLSRLEAACTEFCKVSQEPLLTALSGGAAASGDNECGPRISAVAQAVDAEAVGRLADIADGQAEAHLPGGLASQAAAVAVLAAALPQLPKKVLPRCAAACSRFARQLSMAPDAVNSAELLKDFWKACVEAAAGPATTSRRKSSKGPGNGGGEATTLLEVALQRPKAFAADLQSSLQMHAAVLRPALLQLALGSHGGSTAITANALLLLRSLLANEGGAGQMLLVLIMARVASAQEKQVRAASVALLETLKEAASQEDSGAEALVEAKLLLPNSAVAPEKVWSSLGQQLPVELWTTLLDLILKQKAELIQDPVAAHNVLQKVLGLKGGLPKSSREQACRFWICGLAQLAPDQAAPLTAALPGALVLRSVQEPLVKTAQWAVKSSAAPSLLSAAMSILLHMAKGTMVSASDKIRAAAQEAAVEALRQVAVPLCVGLTEVCEKASEAPQWDPALTRLLGLTCEAVSKVAQALGSHEVVAEAVKALFRLSVATRSLTLPAEEEDTGTGFSLVVAKASSALSEAPLQPKLLQMLLKCSEFQGKQLKARGEVAAQILCEQVAGMDASLDADNAALLRKLGKVAQDASHQSSQGALVQLLLALAALAERLLQAADDASDAAAVAEAVPDVCQCIDEVIPKLSASGLAPVLRCCGALATLASPGTDTAFTTCATALRHHAELLRPDLMALLRGNLRRLWRHPLAEDDAGAPQVRLRTLLSTIFSNGLIEVATGNCLALVQSAGVRASLDFVVLLLLVHRVSAAKPAPKRRKRKRRSEADELTEEIEALTAPAEEDLMLDEALEVLLSVDPGSRYHCLGMLLLTLSAWAVDLHGGSRLPWSGPLLPDDVAAELDENVRLKVLSQGFALAGRFLSEHGLPSDLDGAEVDTSTLMSFTAEGEDDEDVGSVAALSLCHGARAVFIAEAAVFGLAESKEQALCLQRATELRGLLLRSLAVNHPATFFRGVGLALGVKGMAPKAQDLLSEKEFTASLAANVLSGGADALKDRRDLRGEDDVEDEGPGEVCTALCQAAVQHISKRFLAGDVEDGVATTAWNLLDGICRFAKAHASKPLVQLVLPQAGARLDAASGRLQASRVPAAIACCACVETMVDSLGRNILDKLNEFVPPLLQLALTLFAKDSNVNVLLDQVLRSLQALARGVGPFLSPFLGRFLEVSCGGPQNPALQDLASELVASVPHRLLLISVQTATVDSFDTSEERQLEVLDHKLIYMQRLATFYIWILSKETPEFVATVADTIMAALLRLLGISSAAVGAFLLAGVEPAAIPSRALRRDPLRSVSLVDEALQDLSWEQFCSKPSLWQLHQLAAAAFAQFALRLEMEELRSRLVKVLDWARSKQPKLLEQQRLRKAKDFESFDAAADAAAACRVMALTSTMSCIADAAPGIAEELLLPLGTKDVSSALVACRRFAVQIAGQRARKRRKTSEKDANPMEALQSHTWWWFDVACSCLDFIATACKSPSSAGTEAKTFADTAEELRDPVVNLLDIFEFLSEAFGTTTELRKALEAAVVALTNVASESGVKMLVQAILEKSRSEDAEVRLGAVRCVHRIWMDLGVQVVMCLSEVTMYASELLEDEDSRVEMAVRAMIKTMEDCTGESLQDTLKS